MKRILTKDEEMEIAIAYLGGVPIKEISEYFHLSRSGVHRVITRLNIQAERGKRAAK